MTRRPRGLETHLRHPEPPTLPVLFHRVVTGQVDGQEHVRQVRLLQEVEVQPQGQRLRGVPKVVQ